MLSQLVAWLSAYSLTVGLSLGYAYNPSAPVGEVAFETSNAAGGSAAVTTQAATTQSTDLLSQIQSDFLALAAASDSVDQICSGLISAVLQGIPDASYNQSNKHAYASILSAFGVATNKRKLLMRGPLAGRYGAPLTTDSQPTLLSTQHISHASALRRLEASQSNEFDSYHVFGMKPSGDRLVVPKGELHKHILGSSIQGEISVRGLFSIYGVTPVISLAYTTPYCALLTKHLDYSPQVDSFDLYQHFVGQYGGPEVSILIPTKELELTEGRFKLYISALFGLNFKSAKIATHNRHSDEQFVGSKWFSPGIAVGLQFKTPVSHYCRLVLEVVASYPIFVDMLLGVHIGHQIKLDSRSISWVLSTGIENQQNKESAAYVLSDNTVWDLEEYFTLLASLKD